MEETPPAKLEDSKAGFSPWPLVLWPLLLAIVYFLSVGPALKLLLRDRISERTFVTIYAPIGWLYEKTFMKKPIGMYLHLWAPDLFDAQGSNGKH